MPSENPTETNLTSGQKVGGGRYSLIRELGRGGMGVVWLALDERLNDQVALKFLPSQIQHDPVALDDMRRETLRSRRLTHPNIIRIHDLHEAEGEAAFISMEFVDGQNLTALRMERRNRLFTWEFLQPVVRQLCDALDYAHGEKVIHRDLKPANMMLDGRSRLKLADFGIAAVVSDSMSRISLRHATSGTVAYMSPQQIQGQSPRVTDDIYALGASLYELLTSRPPFFSGDIVHQTLHVAPVPPEDRLAELELSNEIPPAVAAMIMACLTKDPLQRPQSAREVSEWIGLNTAKEAIPLKLERVVVSAQPSQEAFEPEPGNAVAEVAPDEPESVNSKRTGISAKKLLWTFGALAVMSGLVWISAQLTSKSRVRQDTQISDKVSVSGSKPERISSSVEEGFVNLFNGHDLAGWDGDPRFWSVKDGVITGQTSEGNIPDKNTFLIWRGATPDDFELRFLFKLVSGNSGVQYRSRNLGNWSVNGYQADISDRDAKGSGGLVIEAPAAYGRPYYGWLVRPGEKVVWTGAGKKESMGSTDKSAEELEAAVKQGEWNDYVITVRSNYFVHKINGNVMMEMTDNDPKARSMSGVIAFQIHRFKARPMLVQFKDIRLKKLGLASASGTVENRAVHPASSGWISLFDGKTLSGWTAPDPGDWRAESDGSIASQGPHSHLFSPNAYTNLEFKAEIKLDPDANGALAFRAQRALGAPTCYMVQATLDKAHPPTGSLFKLTHPNQRFRQETPVRLQTQMANAGTWFTMHIVAVGNRIVVKVNDRIVAEHVDQGGEALLSGYLVLKQWHPGATVMYRNVMVKPLLADPSAAWVEAKEDMPDLP